MDKRVIVVIDDDKKEQILMEHFLKPLRFEVILISTLKGIDGILSVHSPDCVIFDLTERKEDTVTSISHISESYPLIVVSPRKDRAEAVRCVQSGADAYLIKDELTTELLSNHIELAIKNHSVKIQLHSVRSNLTAINKRINEGFKDFNGSLNKIEDSIQELFSKISTDQTYFVEFHEVYMTQITELQDQVEKVLNGGKCENCQ